MTTMSDLPQVDRDEAIRFLQDFVRLNTVNPPGNESIAADYLQARLEPLGFEILRTAAEAGRDCLVATLPGTVGKPTLILNGHTDVQPVAAGWSHDPFAAEIVDGNLYGNGAMDMKAGVAAYVLAAEALIRSGERLRGTLVVQAVADEVSGGAKGTGHLFERGLLKGDYAVVGEPVGLDVYIAHRGMMWFELTVTGRVAHSGRPWQGVNAIAKVSRIIETLSQELGPAFATLTHPMLPTPSISFGMIHGGTKENLVAAECRLTIDRRVLPGESMDAAEEEIRRIIERVQEDDPEDWTFQFRRTVASAPWETDPGNPTVVACQRAFNEVTGEVSNIGALAGLADAHWLARAGIPTAMFGPYVARRWQGEQRWDTITGQANEFVNIEQWLVAIRVYTALIRNLLA